MSKTIMITNCFIIILSLISIIKTDDYVKRYEGYDGYFDCSKEGNKENTDNIKSPEDCFKKSPRTKWKCCYFEFDDNIGCMRYRKNNETDLNDLKYFISRLSTKSVLNCRNNYISYPIAPNFLLISSSSS